MAKHEEKREHMGGKHGGKSHGMGKKISGFGASLGKKHGKSGLEGPAKEFHK